MLNGVYRSCTYLLHAEGSRLQQRAPDTLELSSGWLAGHHKSQPHLPMMGDTAIGWFAERYKSQPRLPMTGNLVIGWYELAGHHEFQHRMLDADSISLPHTPITGNVIAIGWHAFARRHKFLHRMLDADNQSLPHVPFMSDIDSVGWFTRHHKSWSRVLLTGNIVSIELQWLAEQIQVLHRMPDTENESLPRVSLTGDIISVWKVPQNIEHELQELYNRIVAPFTSDPYVRDGDMSYM